MIGDGYVGIAPVPGGRVNVGIVLGPSWRRTLARDGAACGRAMRGVVDPGHRRGSGRLADRAADSTRSPARGRSAAGRSRRAGRLAARRRCGGVPRPVHRRGAPPRARVGRAGAPRPSARIAARRVTARSPPTTARCARRFLAKDAVSWLVQAFLGAARAVRLRRPSGRVTRCRPCDDGPRDGRSRAGRSRARPALPRRAPGTVIDQMHSLDRHRRRRAARPRLRARPRRRALGATSSPTTRARAAREPAARRRAARATSSPGGRSSPVLGLGLPVAWRSRTWSEPATSRLRFVHVAARRTGMDVTWRIEPHRRRLPRLDRARLPRRGCPGCAAFVDRCVHAADRRPDAGHVQGARRGRCGATAGRGRRSAAEPAAPGDLDAIDDATGGASGSPGSG